MVAIFVCPNTTRLMATVQNPQAMLTFLVLSDIHFGVYAVASELTSQSSKNAGAQSHTKSICDALVSKVLELEDRPTALLVPGDLTSIASPSEFNGCVQTVLDIANKLSIRRENVYCTYGNHDVDWRICSLATESKQFVADTRYEHVAATVGSLYCPVQNYSEPGPLPGSGLFQTDHFNLFVANSGYYSTKTQELRHGRLGVEQFKWLSASMERHHCRQRWQILMLHHHPFNYTYPTPIEDVSCVEEGAEIVDLAGRFGIDLICHGHRHHPRLFTQLQNGWLRPVTFFCAGSVGVDARHRDSGRIPNLFHVVSLKTRLAQGGAYGSITSFEYASDGWRGIRDCPETPLDHVHWFGAVTTADQSRDAVQRFIRDQTAEGDTQIFLPIHDLLPPEIKCCRLEVLNAILKEQAPGRGYRVVGKYPEEVALFRQ